MVVVDFLQKMVVVDFFFFFLISRKAKKKTLLISQTFFLQTISRIIFTNVYFLFAKHFFTPVVKII